MARSHPRDTNVTNPGCGLGTSESSKCTSKQEKNSMGCGPRAWGTWQILGAERRLAWKTPWPPNSYRHIRDPLVYKYALCGILPPKVFPNILSYVEKHSLGIQSILTEIWAKLKVSFQMKNKDLIAHFLQPPAPWPCSEPWPRIKNAYKF